MNWVQKVSAASAAALLVGSLPALAAAPSNEELFRIIQQQNQRIENLEGELRKARASDTDTPDQQALENTVKAQQEQINALAERAEKPSVMDRVSIGGYGELHYNNLDADDDSNDLDQLDFHRFVLFIGYDFAEDLRFYSELEIEHSFISGDDDSAGAVELEQAYVQYDINQNTSVLGGQFLAPLGIINETHEPPTFYGVERNDVENIIIPTTYRVGGVQLTHRFGQGFQVDLSLHEGLRIPTTGSSAFRVRSGRQNTAEAIATDEAYSVRMKYSGIPGVELGGAVQYETDPSQDNSDALDSGLFWEVHTVIQRGMFGFRALYAEWDFDIDRSLALAQASAAATASGTPFTPADIASFNAQTARAESQRGWYVEPSIKPFEKLGFYTRYSDIEGARARDEFTQWELGLNYWPHPDVVLKADYRFRDQELASERGRDFDGFDLGIGYQF